MSIFYVFKSEIKSERDETALRVEGKEKQMNLYQIDSSHTEKNYFKLKNTSLARKYLIFFFGVVHSLSPVWLFETPWTAACQAPLFFIVCWSLLKLTSTESVMLANHLILCCPLSKGKKELQRNS